MLEENKESGCDSGTRDRSSIRKAFQKGLTGGLGYRWSDRGWDIRQTPAGENSQEQQRK